MNESELAEIEERAEHWEVMGKIDGEAAPVGRAVSLREADYEALIAAARPPTLEGLEAREAALMERWYQREEAKDNRPSLRPEVRAFAERMEKRLREHDADDGDSWKRTLVPRLLDRLDFAVFELRVARRGDSLERMADCAADVGNYAMMLAHQLTGLFA